MGAGAGNVQQIPPMAAQQLAADPGQVLGRPEQMFASLQQTLPRLQDPAQRLEAARRLSMVMEPPPTEQLAALAQQYVPPGWNPMAQGGMPPLAQMQQGEAVLAQAAGPEVLGGPPSSQSPIAPEALGAIGRALAGSQMQQRRPPMLRPMPMPMQARPSRGIVNPYLAVRRRG